MSVTVVPGRTSSINPSQSSNEFVERIVFSSSGKYLASLTESLITLLFLSNGGLSLVGSIDVNDIVDSAGDDFAGTEGSFCDVVFCPTEDLLFVSTRDSMIGVIKIDKSPLKSGESYDEDEMVSSHAYGEIFYKMRLVTVLLFPVRCFLLSPASECLYVIGVDKRVLFLIDWKNYQNKARRFIMPSLDHDDDPGSPCINSVLPQALNVEFDSLQIESVKVRQSLVVENADSLVLLYENGFVRSFARSRPSEQFSSIFDVSHAHLLAAENNRLAIACLNSVHVFELSSGSCQHRAKFKTDLHSRVSAMAWSEGHLFIGSNENVVMLTRQGTGVLLQHNMDSSPKEVAVSLRMRLMCVLSQDSSEFDIVYLHTSADMFSRSFSANQSQLLISRESMQLMTFPSQQWRHIPLPAAYIQENGLIRSACVQINASSRFILAVASKGFALWSLSTSAFASALKREGRWEVLGDKSQEERLGEIDVFGFLSETVFFTHSKNTKEILLWSVLKRIDVGFTLAVTKLVSGDIKLAASDSAKGIIVLTYEKENRMDVFQLKGDPKQATYRLESIAKLPCDFPLNLRQLCLVGNSTVLGISDTDEVFMRTGERLCGNVERIFVCPAIGLDSVKTRRSIVEVSTSPSEARTPPRTETVSTPETPSNSDLDSPEETDGESEPGLEFEEPMGIASSPIVYFIGEQECKFCTNLNRVPKTKTKVVKYIQRGNPLVYMQDVRGNIAVWVIASSGRFAGRLEFVIRFDDSIDFLSNQIVGISGEWGVLASIAPSGGHISLTSAVHPILSLLPEQGAHRLCVRLEHSPFFMAIMEMWLHSCLAQALPLLSKIETVGPHCLHIESESVCQHWLTRTVLDKLLTAFKIARHFPSVYGSVFAAAVRKSEPQVTFPLATCGAFGGETAEETFQRIVEKRRLREAALLFVIIQENTGPVVVRERFGIPLFREALIEHNYPLAREIAHFHFSFSKRLRSPGDFAWRPSQTDEEGVEQHLQSSIETVVIAHLNFLVNESMDWLRLVRFSETLRLVLGEWLPLIAKQEYLALSQLISSFRVMVSAFASEEWETITAPLIDAFRACEWTSHWKALALAIESRELVQECLTRNGVTSNVQGEVDKLFLQYCNN